jgi:hypothetical protein
MSDFEKEMSKALMNRAYTAKALKTLKEAKVDYETTPKSGDEASADLYDAIREAISLLENVKTT